MPLCHLCVPAVVAPRPRPARVYIDAEVGSPGSELARRAAHQGETGPLPACWAATPDRTHRGSRIRRSGIPGTTFGDARSGTPAARFESGDYPTSWKAPLAISKSTPVAEGASAVVGFDTIADTTKVSPLLFLAR